MKQSFFRIFSAFFLREHTRHSSEPPSSDVRHEIRETNVKSALNTTVFSPSLADKAMCSRGRRIKMIFSRVTHLDLGRYSGLNIRRSAANFCCAKLLNGKCESDWHERNGRNEKRQTSVCVCLSISIYLSIHLSFPFFCLSMHGCNARRHCEFYCQERKYVPICTLITRNCTFCRR